MRASSHRLIIGIALAFALLPAGLARADKVDDFKQAAGKSGCEAIPYSSEKGTCKGKQSHKDSVCKGFGCERPEAEKLLGKLKEKRKNLADAKSRNNQSAVPGLEHDINELLVRLEKLRSDAKQKIGVCENCIKAREEVQKVFGAVKSKVAAERDPVLKQYIDTLVAHYEKGAKEHEDPIKQVNAALTHCKWVSSMSF